jgi:recombination associated protein RdgC
MWFKNLVVYRFGAEWTVSLADLEDRCAQFSLQPCGAFDMQTRGWVHSSVLKRYVHSTNGQHLIALGMEQKLLPASIIRQVTAERAIDLEQQQGYPVGRRQMRELKERVTEELRARALTRRTTTYAWIDPINRWLVVDAAGGARSDAVIDTLRDTLGGSLPVTFLEVEKAPHSSMASWLMLGEAPGNFTIEQDLELQSVDQSKATIRYARHPLDGKEIRAHLEGGMYVTRLGLTWRDRLSFVLTDKLQIKRVEFLGVDKEKSEDGAEISPEEQFDMDFALMSGELARMLAELTEVLGGEGKRQQAAAA